MAPKIPNIRNAELDEAYSAMLPKKSMGDQMGMRGPYNPENVYPGSPWTPTWLPTPNEVRLKVEGSSRRVLEDWGTLRGVVERHWVVLGKRWGKKTRKQQRDVLGRAWPKMSPTHRPDYEAYRTENTGRRHQGLSKYPEAYMWPYINLEDLSSKSLITFITSRARNAPSVFARNDVEATHLGTVCHALEEQAFLPGWTLFMDGDTPETYGKLVSWDDDKDAVDLMFSQRQFTPGEGLRVLEIQERIYPFLIKCCELILHDLASAGSLLDDKYPIAEEEIVATTSNGAADGGEILPTLVSIAEDAPYRPPENLNLNRIRGIIAAKRSAAEDNLLALREDPGYFADTIMDWSEHRNDRLLDWNGMPHPTGPHTEEFWERVIRNVIATSYHDFMGWDLLLLYVNRVAELQEKYKDEISYDRQLPHEYLIALLKFTQLLEMSCESPIFYMRNIQSSPPLRQYFHRAPQMPGTIMMDIRPIKPSDPFFHKPWGLLLMLWEPEQRKLIGLTNIIDMFEHVMQDPTEKRNMSPYMLDLFSDLSVLTRLLHELEIYQPWGATFNDEYEKNTLEVMALFDDAKPQMDWMEHMDDALRDFVHLAMPKDGKFNYPTDKKRTKQTTEAMIRAENNLDTFWRKYDSNWKRMTGKSVDASLGPHIPAHRGQPLARTKPWVEPVKNVQQGLEKLELKNREQKECSDAKEEKLPTPAKRKLKTRGLAHPTEVPEPSDAPGAQPDTQPTLKVDARAMKVFSTLFHTPNQNDKPGEVARQEFLHAMASTGFAIQKLYGSIWQFEPSTLDVERSVQFHEPHPGTKMSFNVARRIGRRLTRAYGWHSGMFVLE